MKKKLEELPIVSIQTLYHVGNLDKKPKNRNFSYEGKGLSVSKHPNTWRNIEPSVSGTTYKLEPNTEGIFYEADPETPRDKVIDWSIKKGYVERVNGWKEKSYDVETGEWRYSLHYDYDEAIKSSQADIREDAYVEETTVLKLKQKGIDYWKDAFSTEATSVSPVSIRGLTPVWFAQDFDVDGVWWPNKLEPKSLSAPKGVIFQHKLPEWETKKVDDSFYH